MVRLFIPYAVGLALIPLDSEAVDFSKQVRPILSENCFFCHGPDEAKREAGLRLDEEKTAKADNEGVIAVVPGDPDKSALIQRIVSTDPDEVMPPPKQHKEIPAAQIELLKQWIREGAPWGGHWSYEKVVRPEVRPIGESKGHPVDAFLLARLKEEKLSYSPEANAAVLVRRVALDLTGLPPTVEELQMFAPVSGGTLNPQAYEKLVDHYLAKPAFGEHWARQWLDLARYADSSGYPSDQPREIWLYRDWVVKALNANMPFDQFTIEQLAGDLLPKPTDDQLIATAFHRNTMTQNEGGTSDEEFRVAAIVDRVNTTFAVWMGTTLACAQCHTHKYDPLTQKEYFQIYAFLNQSADADKKDESPVHELVTPEVKRQREGWQKEITRLEAQFAQPSDAWLKGLEAWLATPPEVKDKKVSAALKVAAEKRSKDELKLIRTYYARYVSPDAKTERTRLSQLSQEMARTKPVTVPVMLDLPGKDRRKTQVQLRGNWQALGEVVHEGTPAVFPALPADAPRNRLTLARWLVSWENPLTARVTVNRLWESLFGIGIVRTSEEFGSQGELPFHPELLDWLAAEFMESGWDVKHMIKLLVTTRAYRQESSSTDELNERDPDNRLLARGPRFRPSGELLRDQALAVSGLLSPKMGGPAVRPLAPNMGLTTAFGRSNDWTVSEGEDRHRRSLYTEVRRNSPYPSFTTFDAPNREVCTIRRGRTNTPLQAFVTLNDPVFIEANQALARRVMSAEDKLAAMYEVCVSRQPSATERAALQKLHDEALTDYRADLESAQKMATEPLGPAPKGADLAELAAWTTVANVVMNLDEFLMRR
ncbi:Planctomycete cytochrome C [Prosthecobacter debontii]|uniref:Planctomycete cytochrome C n=1 Tax=Prosthecobacter debontii TaxID=48467 RepID=A0A1T4YHC4_9BACT|nr:PSD1 and planctomycete cytochrome C domain-containing protein [Prosthecobacter debontii]SKB01060.1 Planctomycete cytochrome C [Prosthecobacter debontii]